MILHPQDLTSRGIDSRSKILTFTPFTFSEMIEYSEEYETLKTRLQKFLLDYKWVKKKFDNWESISLIDLSYCIFMMKKISIASDTSFTTEYKCSDCSEVNTLYLDTTRLANPLNLVYDIKGTINLNNKEYDYSIPNLEEFDKVLDKINRFNKVKELRLIKLISVFTDFEASPNLIERLVVDATGDDIIRLLTLESMYFDDKIVIDHKCRSCKEGSWSISMDILIDQLFRNLLLTRESIETKINTKQIC